MKNQLKLGIFTIELNPIIKFSARTFSKCVLVPLYQYFSRRFWPSAASWCLVYLDRNSDNYHWLLGANFQFFELVFYEIWFCRKFFEDDDPFGFFLLLVQQLLSTFSYMTIFSAYCTCFIGLCTYLSACVTDFKTIASRLDEELLKMNQINRKKFVFTTQRTINELIELHNDVLGWILRNVYALLNFFNEICFFSIMKSTKNLMSGPQFFQFIIFVAYNVLAIRSSEEALQNLTLESVACFYCLFWETILVYALCHFATKITTELFKMANVAYTMCWYSLPLAQQKMIIPIIRQGQIHFDLNGYIFSSSVETFVKVKQYM